MLIEQPPFIFRNLIAKDGVWRMSDKEKKVYLTFDDGPIPEVTPWVLEILRKYGIKATFFMVGENVYKHQDVYNMVASDGHSIGNHTFNHLQGLFTNSDLYLENVRKSETLIPKGLFRPPHGILRKAQYERIKRDYKIIMWDLVTRDYNKDLTGEEVFSIVRKYTRNGSIIVFHDSLKSEKNIRFALPKSIEWLKGEGYKFGVL